MIYFNFSHEIITIDLFTLDNDVNDEFDVDTIHVRIEFIAVLFIASEVCLRKDNIVMDVIEA